MVTAEMATALPVLVIVVWAAVTAVVVAQLRVRCADAARDAALALARGDASSVQRRADEAAGRHVDVFVQDEADDVRVTVRMALRPLGWLGQLSLQESAVVPAEPGHSP